MENSKKSVLIFVFFAFFQKDQGDHASAQDEEGAPTQPSSGLEASSSQQVEVKKDMVEDDGNSKALVDWPQASQVRTPLPHAPEARMKCSQPNCLDLN